MKPKEIRYSSTENFTIELSKHLNSKNVEITIYPKKWAINEKTESEGVWNSNNYTVYADVWQKGAEMGYCDGLDEFLKMISENDITELNGENFYNLTLLQSLGGDINITKVEWDMPLTDDLKKELEKYGGENQLFDDGDESIEDIVFENGDILKIEVKINDIKYILSKEEIIEDNKKENIIKTSIICYVVGVDNTIHKVKNNNYYFARAFQKENGGIVHQKTTIYYKNGNIKEEEFCKEVEESYANGFHFQRYVKKYNENGNLHYEGTFEYFSMKRLGIHKQYYENGQLDAQVDYKFGEMNGLSKSYFQSGELQSEGMFKDNKREGVWIGYHKNGKLSKKGEFKNGEASSLLEKWDENGEAIK